MKAIETQYKGYRFRSRLEARWAVFFDALGVKWVYESEGYDLPNGRRYLPDFLLPDHEVYVEVKASIKALTFDDGEKIRLFGEEKQIITLFDLLDPTDTAVTPCGILTNGRGSFAFNWCYTDRIFGLAVSKEDWGLWFPPMPFVVPICSRDAFSDNFDLFSALTRGPRLLDAYRAARSARFEHGEKPEWSN